jgi:hypothetical protein
VTRLCVKGFYPRTFLERQNTHEMCILSLMLRLTAATESGFPMYSKVPLLKSLETNVPNIIRDCVKGEDGGVERSINAQDQESSI